jgi:hypothetical protein
LQFLIGHHAAETDVEAHLATLVRSSRVAGIGVHHASEWTALARLAEHGEHLGLAIAHVDHNRQTSILHQPQMAVEKVLLNFKRRVIPIAIEAGFTERDDAFLPRELHHVAPVTGLRLCSVVGMNADRRENSVVSAGQLEHACAVCGCRADGDNGCHTRGIRPRYNLVAVGSKLVVFQVGVRVDQHFSECGLCECGMWNGRNSAARLKTQ